MSSNTIPTSIQGSPVAARQIDEQRAVRILGKGSISKIEDLYSHVMDDGSHGSSFIGRVKEFEAEIIRSKDVIRKKLFVSREHKAEATRYLDEISAGFCYDLSEELEDSNLADVHAKFTALEEGKLPISSFFELEEELNELSSVYRTLGRIDAGYADTLAELETKVGTFRRKHYMELQAIMTVASRAGVVPRSESPAALYGVYSESLIAISKDIERTSDPNLLVILRAELEKLHTIVTGSIEEQSDHNQIDLVDNVSSEIEVARNFLEKKMDHVKNSDDYKKKVDIALEVTVDDFDGRKEVLDSLDDLIDAMKAVNNHQMVFLLELKKEEMLDKLSQNVQVILNHIESSVLELSGRGAPDDVAEDKLLKDGIGEGHLNSIEESLQDMEREIKELSSKYSDFNIPAGTSARINAVKEGVEVLRERAITILALDLSIATAEIDRLLTVSLKVRTDFFLGFSDKLKILREIKTIAGSLDDAELEVNPELAKVDEQIKRLKDSYKIHIELLGSSITRYESVKEQELLDVYGNSDLFDVIDVALTSAQMDYTQQDNSLKLTGRSSHLEQIGAMQNRLENIKASAGDLAINRVEALKGRIDQLEMVPAAERVKYLQAIEEGRKTLEGLLPVAVKHNFIDDSFDEAGVLSLITRLDALVEEIPLN